MGAFGIGISVDLEQENRSSAINIRLNFIILSFRKLNNKIKLVSEITSCVCGICGAWF